MISVAQITKEIIEKSPFIEEALYEKLINVSSLARRIKPEVEKRTGNIVTEASIVMAINRMTIEEKYYMMKSIASYLKNIGDLTIRSKINVYTYRNSPKLSKLQSLLMEASEVKSEAVCTFSQGITERTVIINDLLKETLIATFAKEDLISKRENLSAITIRLPQDNTVYAGVYYFILKQLAWQNIPIVEVISTTNEFTMVVDNKDIQSAFRILIKLKNPN